MCVNRSFFLASAAVVVVLLFTIAVTVTVTEAYLPPHNPPWPPTYSVTESLITMQCNSSGWSNADRAAMFGIVSYDWSNAKAQWAKQTPMDCEERLYEQAVRLENARRRRRTKQEGDSNKPNNSNSNSNTHSHTFVYRNIVKALPWFSTVRAKLIDPAYAGFFLGFSNATNNNTAQYHVPRCAAEDPSKCSDLYHDQEQTPGVPTHDSPHPDGACDKQGCDCGEGLPCGEYYFDHRNGTMLREWLVEEVVLGALLGSSNKNHKDSDNANYNANSNANTIIDGLFLDDYWCSDLLCRETDNTVKGCPCDNPQQGPTEAHVHAVKDMGLSDRDVRDIAVEWNATMALAERRLLDRGAYTWWLMEGQENANAMPYLLDLDSGPDADIKVDDNDGDRQWQSRRSERCIRILEDACREDSSWQTTPRLLGFSVNTTTHKLLNFDVEWAFFLLVRGPYSWAGWGEWGMTWPFQKEPGHGVLPPLPHGVPLPHKLTPEGQTDYGVPLGVCYRYDESDTDTGTDTETSTSSGVFRREWSNGWVVELDCNKNSNSHSYTDTKCRDEPCLPFGVKQRIFLRDVVASSSSIEWKP